MPNTGNRVCSMGYSQGGGGAIHAYDNGSSAFICSVSIAPDITFTSNANATGLNRILYLGGSADNVAPVGRNANQLFGQTSQPRAIGVVNGASHFEVLGNGGRFRGYAIGFLVAALRADDPDAGKARGLFNGGGGCGLDADPRYGDVTCQGSF